MPRFPTPEDLSFQTQTVTKFYYRIKICFSQNQNIEVLFEWDIVKMVFVTWAFSWPVSSQNNLYAWQLKLVHLMKLYDIKNLLDM